MVGRWGGGWGGVNGVRRGGGGGGDRPPRVVVRPPPVKKSAPPVKKSAPPVKKSAPPPPAEGRDNVNIILSVLGVDTTAGQCWNPEEQTIYRYCTVGWVKL